MSEQSVIGTPPAARSVARVVTVPPEAPGFIGEGHTAVEVVSPQEFHNNDPFIILMADRIELAPGEKAGGAHPHAGFEIVTFITEGELRDRDEGTLKAGDVLWTTAGSGIIHNEDAEPHGRTRILQMWVTIPSEHRWDPPRFSVTLRDAAPVSRLPGVEVRVYSGESHGVNAGSHLYLPLTMVDVRLEPDAVFDQDVPGTYNGFFYVLEGEVEAPSGTQVRADQVGWLDDPATDGSTTLRLVGGPHGARLVFYAAERQRVPIVMHGPFVGETRADLMKVSKAFMEGRLPRISELAAGVRLDAKNE